MNRHIALVAALSSGLALAACGRTPQPEAVPPPPPANAEMPAPASPTNSESPPPDAAPTAPDQPAPDAPPPQDPSPVPKPTSTEPALDAMKPALANASKMGVSVDLRYQVDAATAGGPLTLHLAAVPQVDGVAVDLSVQQAAGLSLAPGALAVQKSADGAVYRRNYAVTRAAAAPSSVRVLVRTDSESGSAHAFFTVPLDGTSAQNKRDSVKQR